MFFFTMRLFNKFSNEIFAQLKRVNNFKNIQIYTLTVLNGTEPWLRIDNAPDQPTPALDFDSMLGNNFPGYIKNEYTYDDSGFSTDNKDDLILQQQVQQQQQQQLGVVDMNCSQLTSNNVNNNNNNNNNTTTNNPANNNNNGADNNSAITFQNNNNDWQMVDHNLTDQVSQSLYFSNKKNLLIEICSQESSESLLRSALQGKGYATKGLAQQLQNGMTLIPTNKICDTELRGVLFAQDPVSLEEFFFPFAQHHLFFDIAIIPINKKVDHLTNVESFEKLISKLGTDTEYITQYNLLCTYQSGFRNIEPYNHSV